MSASAEVDSFDVLRAVSTRVLSDRLIQSRNDQDGI